MICNQPNLLTQAQKSVKYFGFYEKKENGRVEHGWDEPPNKPVLSWVEGLGG